MKRNLHAIALAAAVTAAAALGASTRTATAGGQVTVGVTETIASYNPYADSVSLAYGIWCQVLGCLGIYDFAKADYVGMLAESWEVDKADPNIWTVPSQARRSSARTTARNSPPKTWCILVPADQHRSAEPAEAEHRAGQGDDRGRPLYGEDRHQGADRVAARVPVRPLHHHRQGPLRQIRSARGRPEISSGAGAPTSSRSSRSVSASCWRRTRAIRTSSRRTRTR